MTYSPIYQPIDDPHRRAAVMLGHATKGLPYNRRTRFMVMQHFTETTIIKTSKEIPQEKIVVMLDRLFPDWREPIPNEPPTETQKTLRQMAEGYSYILVKEHGMPPKE